MLNKRKKRILFLLPGIYPCETGGIEIFHYYFVQAIAEYYQVYVATHCDHFHPGHDVKVLLHPRRLLNSHTTAVMYHCLKWIFKFRQEIDLIHIPYSSKAIIQRYDALLGTQFLRIPYVLRIHGGGLYPSHPFALHQVLFDKASAVIAVSTPVRCEYESRHGRRIDMIPSMLPFLFSPLTRQQIREKWAVDESDQIILFLGSIKKIKGPDLLLDAFSLLCPEFIQKHRLKLVFVGDGAMRAALETRSAQSTVSSWTRFLGKVPHEMVCELYKMADIFCIPSQMEARPLALAEALYNGLPSIGSDIPTIKNIIKHKENGLLFQTGNSSDLAVKFRKMVLDNNLRTTLGENARRSYMQFYDYEKMVQDYCEVYDRAIASSLKKS